MARRSRTGPGTESAYVDRFGILLVLTILSLVVQTLVDMRASFLAATVVQSSVVVVLILALRSSGVRDRRRRLLDWLLVVGILASIAVALVDRYVTAVSADVPTAFSPVALAAALAAPVLITRRVLHHTRVTRATVLGAIASYLLIAMAFALAFLAVDQYQATPFFGQDEPTTTFFYFSLVSVATLGYGDVTPATPLGQLLGAMDAVVGQVFLVTLVAFVVGRLVSEQGRSERVEPGA